MASILFMIDFLFLFATQQSVFVCKISGLSKRRIDFHVTFFQSSKFEILRSSRFFHLIYFFLFFIDSFPPSHFAVTIYFACAHFIPDFLLFFITLYLLDFSECLIQTNYSKVSCISH